VEVWHDVTNLEPGVRLIKTLPEEVSRADRLIAVLSEKALESSWTSLEWFSAESILPLTLDQAYRRSAHPKIQGLKVLSFENWTQGTVLDDGFKLVLRRLDRSKMD
jgi:hypothetical protein